VKISEKVRRIYDRRPYPCGAQSLKHSGWALALDWVDAIGRNGAWVGETPRVLVAGCGAGAEAFDLQRRLPSAEIVAVDFSSRSIALAKRLQRRSRKMSGIRFLTGDLGDRELPARVGGEFDLITCHGVLSYIPGPSRVLKNLGRCLKPDGVLYLGVNGAAHVSTRIRHILAIFGFDMNEYTEKSHMRDIVRLCDTVLSPEGLPSISGARAEFLSSDLFGPLIQNLTLAQWAECARRGGLHFRGSLSSIRLIRLIAGNDLVPLLMPRSRASAGILLEQIRPSQFHRLLFARTSAPDPPWASRGRLPEWRIKLTGLYRVRLPKPAPRMLDRLRKVTISSVTLKISSEWSMPEWEVELLRSGDGRHQVASLLRKMPLSVPFADLRKQLFLLYQLGIINLLHPGTAPGAY